MKDPTPDSVAKEIADWVGFGLWNSGSYWDPNVIEGDSVGTEGNVIMLKVRGSEKRFKATVEEIP